MLIHPLCQCQTLQIFENMDENVENANKNLIPWLYVNNVIQQ